MAGLTTEDRSLKATVASTDTVSHPRTGGARRIGPVVATLATVVGALCVAGTSVVHLQLWMTGYRHIATIGPLFLVQAIAGFVLTAVIAVWHRWYVAGAGALFLLSTAGGLIISTQFSLFGFKDSFGAPYAGMALVLEGVGAAVLGAGAVGRLRQGRAQREQTTNSAVSPSGKTSI